MSTNPGEGIVWGHPKQPKAFPVDHPKSRTDPFKTETITLCKGHMRTAGCLPLPCDIRFEKDQPIKLRDGTTIYTDIYRPIDSGEHAVPAILAWSPYGKTGGGGCQALDDMPFRAGVPKSKLSEFQKWEGPDPGYWVQHGYAIVNPDSRGVGYSEGNIRVFGVEDSEDGAEVVDWIGERAWCNGKVGMTGNSWLAVGQWFIAAERPKHLAAIAPWEGFADFYREGVVIGGVETMGMINFVLQILSINRGQNYWENPAALHFQHPIHGERHAEKAAKVKDITVPAYVGASWSSVVHTFGSIRSFLRLQSPKWLRVHDTMEWPDYYDQANTTDLHRFFDRYLKDIDNGWESTPQLRAKIIDTANPLPGMGTLLSAPAFPPPSQAPLRLFLSGSDHKLSPTYPQPSQTTYTASSEFLAFEYTFTSTTTLCGAMDVQLAASVIGSQDSDIFLRFEKILSDPNNSDKGTTVGEQLVIPFSSAWQTSLIRTVHWLNVANETKMAHYRGPKGQIRLSRREEDTSTPITGFPVSRMDQIQPMVESEVVAFKVPVTPIGMLFRKGEKLRLRVMGVDDSFFPPVPMAKLKVEQGEIADVNGKGKVSIHCGERDLRLSSYVILPVISE